MCRFNEDIQSMANQNDRTEMLMLSLSNQINAVKINLHNSIDSKIEHLNSNLKNSQEYIKIQFDDIKEDIKELKGDRKDDRKEFMIKIDEVTHEKECPQGLDLEVRKLKDTMFKLIEDIEFYVFIKKYKFIQLTMIITMIVFVLVCYNAFNGTETQKNVQAIENVITKTK